MIQPTNAEIQTARLHSLLAASAAGDQIAFSQFYDLTRRKLFGIAIAILKRPDLAEEVLQEGYVKIWHHACSYDPARSSPVTWTVTIVRNHALDVVRRKDIILECDEQAMLCLPDDQETALESLEAADHRSQALAALRSLTPLQRSLIVAAYIHGESREQLAARFGTPVGTIKTWLRRAILAAQASIANDIRDQNERNSKRSIIERRVVRPLINYRHKATLAS